ncbi:MAG TPA: porin family protein [Vicinamibacterales bacterium]|nr:porin family protein [Vicinamibacterales bacterium]
MTFLLAVAPASAQTAAGSRTTSDGFGIKGGVVSSTLDLELPDFIVSPKKQTGLTAGVFFGLPLFGPVHLDVEALVTTKGARYDLDDFENELRLMYLEIPVLARVGFGRGGGFTAYVSGGPSFALKLKEVQKEGGEEIIENDEVKTSDIGVAIGGGVTFGRWIVDTRYTLGLVDIVNVDAGGFAEPTAKNKALSLTVGYRWR